MVKVGTMERPEKPTLKLAVLAMCHECMGHYADGKVDCENYGCPLYFWMPRRTESEIDLTWLNYNPKKKGKILWADCGRELTAEQRAELAERFKRLRESRKGD